jgi:TctA family transporter
MGFILGGMVDRELLKTFLLFEDDLAGLWERPAFIVLIVITALSIAWPKITTAIKSLRK